MSSCGWRGTASSCGRKAEKMEIVASQTIYPSFAWYWVVAVVVLIFVGIMLMCFEIFVFPGFGAPGVIGIVFLLGGVVLSWITLGPAWGALVSVSSIAFSTGMFIVATRSKFVRKRMVLDEKPGPGGGTEAEDLRELIGKTGETRSDLRPAGIAIIENERIDVVSDGGFIDRGQKIKVIAIDGPRVVVEMAKEEGSE